MDVKGGGKTLRNPYSKKKSKRSKTFFVVLFVLSALALLLLSCFVTLLHHAYHLPHNADSVVDTSISSSIILDSSNDGSGNNASATTATKTKAKATATIKAKAKANDEGSPPVIAYAISLTSCSATPTLVDGAAMLGHSIHLNSVRNTNTATGKPPSGYDYKLYALFHTSIIEEDSNSKASGNVDDNECASILQKLGYEVVVVDIPVPLDEIQNDFLRERLPQNGCCGEKEFIKLWAYTLDDHPFVVHLDLDTIILRPMDEIFDFGLHGKPITTSTKFVFDTPIDGSDNNKGIENEEAKKDVIMWDKEEQSSGHNWSTINAFFTRDYNMRPAGKRPVGVQGGFLILRPSKQIFESFQSIIREGNFESQKGWGGKGYQFYGAMTFQGIIPYFYDIIQPNTSIELNRCLYNTMADNPRDKRTVNNVVSGKCRDGRNDCEDCRERDIQDVRTAHFTLCQKPWQCLPHKSDVLQQRLCRKLFGEWYKVRADLELSCSLKNHVPIILIQHLSLPKTKNMWYLLSY
mmetsp:Transcript_4309/g.6308  ORF Transcript_4309/g.6308 Transcript_4309/m.6308 type:complete len:520 (-) Transcript_4309:207-1766(-)